MPTVITIKGIDESIANLQYRNKSALKYQLVQAIRQFYTDEESIESLQNIDGDELIKRLWPNGNDPLAVRSRRKNLNSIKSSINTDLKKLFQAGLNPDGIIIGATNTFVMSDEAKEAVLEAFRTSMEKSGAVNLGKMLDVLNIVNEALSNVDGIIEQEGASAADKLQQLKSLIQGLSSKIDRDQFRTDQKPGKLQIMDDQSSSASRAEAPELGSPPPVLRELLDFPAEESEVTGEVFEGTLAPEDIPEGMLVDDIETDASARVDLGDLDEMALEDQDQEERGAFAIEDRFDAKARLAEEEEGEEGEEEDVQIEETDLETNEVGIEEASSVEEIAADEEIEFAATETVEEVVELVDEDFYQSADLEEPAAEEGNSAGAIDSRSGEEKIETLSGAAERNGEPHEAQAGEEQSAEGLFEDAESEIIESEELDAGAEELQDVQTQPENLEPEGESEEAPPDLKDLETLESLPESKTGEWLEKAEEDIEELDLETGESEAQVLSGSLHDKAEPEEAAAGSGRVLLSGAGLAGADLSDEGLESQAAGPMTKDEMSSADSDVELEGDLIEGTKSDPEFDIEKRVEQEEKEELSAENTVVDQTTLDEIRPGELDEEFELDDENALMEELEEELSAKEMVAEDAGNTEILAPDQELESIGEEEVLEEIEGETLQERIADRPVQEETGQAVVPEPPSVLPEGLLGSATWDAGGQKKDLSQVRYLAEEFNDSLAAMDKFYNHYILIPGGRYLFGSRHPRKNERPEKSVELSGFYIGKFPVTNALFEIFIEKTGYKTLAEKRGEGLVYYPRCRQVQDERSGLKKYTYHSALVSERVKGACWYQPFGPGSTLHRKRNHPVVQVGLEDAMAFAAWTGKRLPSEMEWEIAARGPKGSDYHWASRWKKGACNIEESDIGDTTPVERYLAHANAWGLADTLGNVLEWTMDWIENENGRKYYIVKGACWISKQGLRLTENNQLERDTCSNILGFRCVAY